MGSVVACVGMVIIIGRGDLFALLCFDFNAGDLFIVDGAMCLGLYTVLLRRAHFALERLPLLATMFSSSWLFKKAKSQRPGPGAGAESQTPEWLERWETLGANESV